MISQSTLHRIFSAEAFVHAATAARAEAVRIYDERTDPVLAMLLNQDGASVEPGRLSVEVSWTERRNISWRRVVEQRLGRDVARQILSEIKPTRTPYLDINGPAFVGSRERAVSEVIDSFLAEFEKASV